MSSGRHSKVASVIVKEYPLSQINDFVEAFTRASGPSVANGDACGNGCGNNCIRPLDPFNLASISKQEMAQARMDEKGLRAALAQQVMLQLKLVHE